MSLLTEQEIREAHEKHSNEFLFEDTINFARAIESAVIEKIKAQGFVGYWNGRETAFYEHELLDATPPFHDINIPLYRLPEGE